MSDDSEMSSAQIKRLARASTVTAAQLAVVQDLLAASGRKYSDDNFNAVLAALASNYMTETIRMVPTK